MNVLKTYLQNVQARLENATPGKWTLAKKDMASPLTLVGPMKVNKYNEYKSGNVSAECFAPTLGEAENNAELIANCPTDLSTLLQIVKIQSEVIEKIADNTDYFGASDIANEAIEQVNTLVSGGK